MNYQQQQAERSFVEVRLLVIFAAGLLLLALGLPSLLRALDTNGDNLDDTWEAQYGITTSAYASTNLVGWWQLNGTNSTDNAADRSGNGITGTLSGFPSVAYGTGLFSNALYFTTNSAVSFPTTNGALNATNQFTFSSWFRATNNLSLPATIATWSDAATNGWSVGVATNGVANVTFFDGATEQVVQATTGAVNLYDGGWHQVAATYATNQVATVYVDGTGEATNTITGWTPGTVSSFIFGALTGTTNNPYALDETRLYNRALGATEIPQLPLTYSDLNGSGLSIFQDYLESLNPFLTTSIVTSGFLSSGLTGYYGSSNPTLTKTSGDLQIVSVSTFATNALVVHVKNSGGTALVGAPITFSIPITSDGGISLTTGGTTTTSLSMTTDSSGNATVYYKSGPEGIQNNTIYATAVSTAGSVSVTFTEYCGVQSNLVMWLRADAGVTSSSGNVSAWADQSVSAHNASQTNSSYQPSLITNDVNGEPAIRLNGVHDYLNTTLSGFGGTGLTFFVVTGGQNYQSLVRTQDGSGNYLVYPWSSTQLFINSNDGGTGGGIYCGLISGAWNLGETRYQSSGLMQTYRNGTLVSQRSSGSASLPNPSSTLVLGSLLGTSEFANCDLAEVLIYKRSVSDTERQQIEGYLANKYGLYAPNATWPSSYSSAVQTEITKHLWNKAQADNYVALQSSNPTMLTTGLSLWLKADAGVTQSSGKVSAWADQTGNNTLVQSTSSTQPTYITSDINGKPALRLNGSQWLQSTGTLGVGLNADMTIISVASTSNPSTQQYTLWLGGINTSQNRGIGYYTSAEIFDTYANWCTGAAVPGANTFVTEGTTLDSTRSQVIFYRNGILTATGTLSGVLNVAPGICVGALAAQVYGWQGDIAETLVYDHQLSTAELQQVGVYLADKYGLYNPNATWWQSYSAQVQTEIQNFQWNKTQADAYVTFLGTSPAVPVSGLSAWYRADSGITTDGSGNVSLWADQSANQNNLSQATSGSRPALVSSSLNGHPVVRFSNQWLSAADNLSLDDSATSVIAVFRPSSLSSYQALVSKPYYSSSWTSPYATYLLGTDSSSHIYLETTSSGAAVNSIASSTTLSTGTAYILQGIYGNGGEQFCVNGSGLGSSAVTNNALDYSGAPVNNLVVGNRSSTNPGAPCSGDLAEILIYNHALSSAEQAQVGIYLANKYGISFTSPAPVITPNGGSYSSSVSVSFASVTYPAVIKYTLDGTAPTASSTTYSSSFTLTQSCPVNAAIFLSGVQISPITTAQFYVGDTGSIGISNSWQTTYFGHTGIDPNAQSPGGSGLTNLQAYLWGYDPTKFSTNGDGLSDLVNHQLGIAGSNYYISSDGLTNAQNLALGIDPFNSSEAPITPPATDPSDHTAPVINLNQPANATLLP